MEVVALRKPRMNFGVDDDTMPSQMPRRSGQSIQSERVGSIKTPSIPKQSGYIRDPLRDAARGAMLPGKRRSINNKIYWETRRNRTDAFGSNL